MNEQTNTNGMSDADDFEIKLSAAFAEYEESVGEAGEGSDPAKAEEAPEGEIAPSKGEEPAAEEASADPAAEEKEPDSAAEPTEDAGTTDGDGNGVDALIEEKEQRLLAEIYAADPEAEDHIESIRDLADPDKFMKLIRRGYDTADAYTLVQLAGKAAPAASAKTEEEEQPPTLKEKQSSKDHMRSTSSSMRSAGVSDITESQMRAAREALPGLSDKDLRKLWRRVAG